MKFAERVVTACLGLGGLNMAVERGHVRLPLAVEFGDKAERWSWCSGSSWLWLVMFEYLRLRTPSRSGTYQRRSRQQGR
jgi:hypothetical protein